VHVRSDRPDAFPLITTHGWPSAWWNFQRVVPRLAQPESDSVFHVVCPSLPGYAWSGKPVESGWGAVRTPDVWAELMSRLGYDRFSPTAATGVTSCRVFSRGDTPSAGEDAPDDPVRPGHRRPVSAGESSRATRAGTRGTLSQGRLGLRRPARHQAPHDRRRARRLARGPASLDRGEVARLVGPGHVRALAARRRPRARRRVGVKADPHWCFGRLLLRELLGERNTDPLTVPAGFSILPKEIVRSPRVAVEVVHLNLRWWRELDRGGHRRSRSARAGGRGDPRLRRGGPLKAIAGRSARPRARGDPSSGSSAIVRWAVLARPARLTVMRRVLVGRGGR